MATEMLIFKFNPATGDVSVSANLQSLQGKDVKKFDDAHAALNLTSMLLAGIIINMSEKEADDFFKDFIEFTKCLSKTISGIHRAPKSGEN